MNASNPQASTISGVDSMQAERATPLPWAPVGDNAVDLDCAGGRLSSDAGLVLRKDPDEPRGLPRALAAVLSDPREARRVNFPQHDRLTQRVWHMAAGDADANDANTVRHDPLFKLRRDRLPAPGAPLASQPTRSRFAHRVSRTALSRMALGLVDPLLASYRPPPRFSCSRSMTPRPGPLGNRHRPGTPPSLAAMAFCRCPSMRASPGAFAPPFARPSVAPVPRGWRCATAWASGCATPGPTPWCWCAVPATWPLPRCCSGAQPKPTSVMGPD